MSEYSEWLALARSIAVDAGSLMKEAREQKAFERDYKADHELVTSTDLALDHFICQQIAERYPHHLILSEESSPVSSLDNNETSPVWIVDPIDGTVNFAHEHHHVAISIGIFYQGICVAGVVHAPFLDECYWALDGEGAYCNGVKLSVSGRGRDELRNALVATGFPYQKTSLAPIIERVSRVLHSCQDIRRNGSAALDLCWVAAGRHDAYFESVKPWDMAAGALIAKEAGAKIGHYDSPSTLWPDVINGDCLLASTPELFDDLLKLLDLGSDIPYVS